MNENLKDELKKTLHKLSDGDFEKFKKCLNAQNKINKKSLCRAKQDHTVKPMMDHYSTNAGDVMVDILRQINQNQLAANLVMALSKSKPTSCTKDAPSASSNYIPTPSVSSSITAHSSATASCPMLTENTFNGPVYVTGQSSQSCPGPDGEVVAPSKALSQVASTAQQEKGRPVTPDLTVILLGKTGSGRSAAANTILGKKFTADMSLDPVTQHCQKVEGKVGQRDITVIDTPGLSCHLNERLRTEIKEYLELGPHVFLLAIRLNEKVTSDVENAVKWIEENLGRDVMCYIIILFTFADKLYNTELDNFCRKSRFIRTLINNCGGRFHSFICDGKQDDCQVIELLKKIDDLVYWNYKMSKYDSKWYNTAQQAREKT